MQNVQNFQVWSNCYKVFSEWQINKKKHQNCKILGKTLKRFKSTKLHLQRITDSKKAQFGLRITSALSFYFNTNIIQEIPTILGPGV